jgi:hypothetical protein
MICYTCLRQGVIARAGGDAESSSRRRRHAGHRDANPAVMPRVRAGSIARGQHCRTVPVAVPKAVISHAAPGENSRHGH